MRSDPSKSSKTNKSQASGSRASRTARANREHKNLTVGGMLDLRAFVPKEIGHIGADHQKALPRIGLNLAKLSPTAK